MSLKKKYPAKFKEKQTLEVDRLVTYPELKEIFGIPYSKMHLWRLEREGKFPKRIPLSCNRVVWEAKSVADCIGGWIAAAKRISAKADGVA
jgi:prophage regulatory protein